MITTPTHMFDRETSERVINIWLFLRLQYNRPNATVTPSFPHIRQRALQSERNFTMGAFKYGADQAVRHIYDVRVARNDLGGNPTASKPKIHSGKTNPSLTPSVLIRVRRFAISKQIRHARKFSTRTLRIRPQAG